MFDKTMHNKKNKKKSKKLENCFKKLYNRYCSDALVV